MSINKWQLFVYDFNSDTKVTKSLWCGVEKLISIGLQVLESSLMNMKKKFYRIWLNNILYANKHLCKYEASRCR